MAHLQGFVPRPYQVAPLRAFDNGIKRMVLCQARRSGKDYLSWQIMISEAIQKPGLYIYLLPTFAQAKKVIFDAVDNDGRTFFSLIPKEMVKFKNETELKITLNNGSTIAFIGTDEPDRLRGLNARGVVISEASRQSDQVWPIILPMLNANQGWCILNSTPAGINWFYDLYVKSKQDKSWFTSLLTIDDTGHYTQTEIDEMRDNMSQAFFDTELYCRFVEGADAVFRNFDDTIWSGTLNPLPGHNYQIGVDLARLHSWTVITPINTTDWQVGKPDRFKGLDWSEVINRIESMALKYRNARIVADGSGVGDPIIEALQRKRLNVTPFKFVEQSRREILNNLLIKMDSKQLRIPLFGPLLDELKAFRYVIKTTASGIDKTKMQVHRGMTDDCVMSLALAVYSLPPKAPQYKSRIDELLNAPYEPPKPKKQLNVAE